MENNTKKINCNVINYADVWGNNEDGYEINHSYNIGFISLDINCTDEEIIQKLKDFGFFTEKVSLENVYIEDNGDFIEIFSKENNYPLCMLDFEK